MKPFCDGSEFDENSDKTATQDPVETTEQKTAAKGQTENGNFDENPDKTATQDPVETTEQKNAAKGQTENGNFAFNIYHNIYIIYLQSQKKAEILSKYWSLTVMA